MSLSSPSRILATVVSTLLLLVATTATALPAMAAGGPNLAAGKPVAASSSKAPHVATNINDGNQGTYWESTNGVFPQWAQVDLGQSTAVDQVVLKLPSSWESRTQTLVVQGSTDGSSFTTIVPSAGRVFSPGSNNTVTIGFAATTTRFVRIHITANTGWPAGQLSELEVYGVAGGGGGGGGTNLAVGKPITGSSFVHVFVPANANDNNLGTYWEGAPGAYPSTLTVDFGANAAITSIVLKLNPDPAWGTRTQTLSVLGRDQGSSSFTTITPSAGYTFNPASGNTVTIPVT
jgi:hypothetical protein